MRVESVRMYVIRPVEPSSRSTPSYSCWAMRMVVRGRKRRRLDASCCSVDVMYGRYELLVRRFFSTPSTRYVAPSSARTMASASAWVLTSSLASASVAPAAPFGRLRRPPERPPPAPLERPTAPLPDPPPPTLPPSPPHLPPPPPPT